MATLPAKEFSENLDQYKGTILRKTKDPGKCWYEVCPNPTEHYLQKLQRKVKLIGRDNYVMLKLAEGWLAFYRYRRITTTDGAKKTVHELVAVPPNYKLRAVKSKPGW